MVDTKKPIVNTRQLTIFAILVIYTMITNAGLFTGKWVLINIIFTLGTFIFVMILKKEEGIPELGDLFKSAVSILISADTNDIKIKKMEAATVLISQQLGDLYEEELQKLTDYIKGTQSDGVVTNEEIESLKAQIDELKKKIAGEQQ